MQGTMPGARRRHGVYYVELSEKNRIQVVNSAVCISKAAAASLPPTATNYVPVHPSLALPRVNTFL